MKNIREMCIRTQMPPAKALQFTHLKKVLTIEWYATHCPNMNCCGSEDCK